MDTISWKIIEFQKSNNKVGYFLSYYYNALGNTENNNYSCFFVCVFYVKIYQYKTLSC